MGFENEKIPGTSRQQPEIALIGDELLKLSLTVKSPTDLTEGIYATAQNQPDAELPPES